MKRVLSIVIVFAMLIAFVPAKASAEGAITTFEELKAAIAAAAESGDYVQIEYSGETLTIAEDITFPENIELYTGQTELIIPEGVTLTNNTFYAVYKLTVNGTLVNNVNSRVYSALTVNGTIENYGNLTLHSTASLSVSGTIYHGQYGDLVWVYDISDIAQFYEVIRSAATDTSENTIYSVNHTCWDIESSKAQLYEDLTIPSNCEVNVQFLAVPAGVTVTNNGLLNVSAVMMIAGTLVNNNDLVVYKNVGGELNFTEGGTYEGDGLLRLYNWENPDFQPEDALPGLDLSPFYTTQTGDGYYFLSLSNSQGGGNDGGNENIITTLEELKEFCAAVEESGEYVHVQYSGETLTITEDLTIPQYLELSAPDTELIVPAGVTLTSNAFSNIYEKITVNGTLHNYAYLQIDNALTVNGTVENRGNIVLNDYGTLTVNGTINHAQYGSFTWRTIPNTPESFFEAVARANAETLSYMRYEIWYDGYNSSDTIEITEDFTIPENCSVDFDESKSMSIVVASGVTLTNNGGLTLYGADMVVNGTLHNDGWMNVVYSYGSTVTFAEGAAYTGNGEIALYDWSGNAFTAEDVLIGLDISMFERNENYGDQIYLSLGAQSGGSEIPTFSTFEELLELCAASEALDYYVQVNYVGEGALQITQDLTIPESLIITAFESQIEVVSGVTLTNNGNLYAAELTVNGTVYNNGALSVSKAVRINGKLFNASALYWTYGMEFSGNDHITHTGTLTHTYWEHFPTNAKELTQTLQIAEADREGGKTHLVYLYVEQDVVLTENTTIPENAQLAFQGASLTVTAGAALRVNGLLEIGDALIVEGTLENNAEVMVYQTIGGTMNIAAGGSYSGGGTLTAYALSADLARASVSGLEITKAEEAENYFWVLTPAIDTETHVHEWSLPAIINPQTCEQDGLVEYTCACGETKQETRPATGHTDVIDAAVAPTATTTGLTEGKHCEVCHKVLIAQEIVPATGSATGGTCGDNLTWMLDADGTLTISGTGAMTDYTQETVAPWDAQRANVKNIVIEAGVTHIGKRSFMSCAAVNLTIPDTVTSIGSMAFYSTELTSVTLPDSVETIGMSAFMSASKLTEITLPKNLKIVEWNLFAECASLKHVTIPAGVTSIGMSAFEACVALETVVIPDSVTSIPTNAFYGCESLTAIAIPEGVSSIGTNTFAGCKSLKTVTIPSGVTEIGLGAFSGCEALEAILIPEGVPNIGTAAFYGCSSLKTITIPASVTNLDNVVFENCTALEEIIFEGDAPTMAEDCFNGIATTAYYPANNATWTDAVKQNYGGTITWTGVYEVLDGESNDWYQTKPSEVSIRADAAIKEFLSVFLNGILIDPQHYDVTEGSTIITFHEDFLATLEPGEYTVTMNFTSGVANAKLTVSESEPIKLGDVNGDGKLNAKDATAILKKIVGKLDNPIENFDLIADVNEDGKVNAKDATKILKTIVGKDSIEGWEK